MIEEIALEKEIPSYTSNGNINTIFRDALYEDYCAKLSVNTTLKRSLISFQDNKKEPFYRWFKYKEGFSSAFVRHLLGLFGQPNSGQVVLDPFAGIGTTVTSSVRNGFNSIGIELLSPGLLAIQARLAALRINSLDLRTTINQINRISFENTKVASKYHFNHLTITTGAFSQKTEIAIANFNKFIEQECHSIDMKAILKFAASSILEDVSYTRKDGQYLRWDSRSPRNLKSHFNKGTIYEFKEKLLEKLQFISDDLETYNENLSQDMSLDLMQGSCLERLPEISDNSVDLVITSPPYCNRYDYTRTYALELAFNGTSNDELKLLRQKLLSATVENKSKQLELAKLYDRLGRSSSYDNIVRTFEGQTALQETLRSLNQNRELLNNKNIPVMVANYFFEMNFVISELSRVLKPGGKIIMVNDNVRYHGDEIPVDLILSEFAKEAGLSTDVIWVLERGKGNSSQQMGIHGRKELRKCVYVWSK